MLARPHFQRYASDARLLPVLRVAVVFPCDHESLQLAQSGAFAGYFEPLLVGPLHRIRAAADAAGLDLSRLRIADTPDDPRAASAHAVALARGGELDALVKGALGIDDLLTPVAASDTGLRTERRLSHAFVADLPGRPAPLLFADTQLNVTPNLAAKKDILENTLELAAALGIRGIRVAAIAATDVVSPVFPSTADAAALKSMAAQGLFGDARVDGPVTMDSALAGDAATGGDGADVIIAPNMEAATLVLRTLVGATGGFAAGLVLGARVPIVAPLRGDSLEVRMASCVLASLFASARSTRLRRAA
jgi:phosphate acetyltransferase